MGNNESIITHYEPTQLADVTTLHNPMNTSLSFFSVGKTTGWYSLGYAVLLRVILFHLKHLRDIPG